MLQLTELTKSFSSGFTLGPLNLSLQNSDTVALFGENGAGKTTLFELITGSLDATAGEIYFNQQRMHPEAFLLKRRIGYLPQYLNLPRWIGGIDMLSYAACLYNIKKPKDIINDALRFWDCHNYATKPLAECSHGMQKRIGLALATIHEPEFLILDEPFSGLDIFHIHALQEKIKDRSQHNRTTILSTHVIPYAATLCNRALLLKSGKLVKVDNWESADYLKRIETVEKYFFG